MEDNGLEILMALSKKPEGVSDEAKVWSEKTLTRLEDWGLIMTTEGHADGSSDQPTTVRV